LIALFLNNYTQMDYENNDEQTSNILSQSIKDLNIEEKYYNYEKEEDEYYMDLNEYYDTYYDDYDDY